MTDPLEITDDGPSNVLILLNLRDPATPLVTVDQGGHLAYLFLDNQCTNDIATDFLVTGKRPHRDLAC